MAKKLKDTYRQTYRLTYRLPLVVLSAALQQKTSKNIYCTESLLFSSHHCLYDQGLASFQKTGVYSPVLKTFKLFDWELFQSCNQYPDPTVPSGFDALSNVWMYSSQVNVIINSVKHLYVQLFHVWTLYPHYLYFLTLLLTIYYFILKISYSIILWWSLNLFLFFTEDFNFK